MSEFFRLLTFILLLNGECKNESLSGQVAVAQVVFNRGIDSSTVEYKQFNCFDNKKIRNALLNNRVKIVLNQVWKTVTVNDIAKFFLIYQLKNFLLFSSDGSYYYWTLDADKHMKKKYSKWVKKLKHTKTIGNHKFYKEKS